MSDDLVKRLREPWFTNGCELYQLEAADRIEQLTAERDAAYTRGYSDAETEISKSALGQKNDFLHFQYANAVNRIEALTVDRAEARAGWHKCEGAWMTAEGKLADVEAERDQLREALERIAKSEPRPKRSRDYDRADVSALQRIARFALKGESHD